MLSIIMFTMTVARYTGSVMCTTSKYSDSMIGYDRMSKLPVTGMRDRGFPLEDK